MPIYEYLCRRCDRRFEKLVRRWGEAVTCPSCLGAAVDKQISTFAVASAGAVPPEGCGRSDGGCGAPACGGGCCQYPN
jgi:putative FmdB family regulatory protein